MGMNTFPYHMIITSFQTLFPASLPGFKQGSHGNETQIKHVQSLKFPLIICNDPCVMRQTAFHKHAPTYIALVAKENHVLEIVPTSGF